MSNLVIPEFPWKKLAELLEEVMFGVEVLVDHVAIMDLRHLVVAAEDAKGIYI